MKLQTNLEFYRRTGDAWNAMYQDCLKANKSIEFEQYIMRDDVIGRKFLALFLSKAKKGIAIHLLLDQIGSRSLKHSPLIKEIRKNGGKVCFYNPISWIHILMPSKWFPRDHTKTMLIDSHIGYIGSVCLADYMQDWRDLYVRVTGELTDAIKQDFAHIWGGAHGVASPPRPDTIESAFTYLVARARMLPSPIYEELLSKIDSAKTNIYLATPYFMPPYRLQFALLRAIKRGVIVKVMITKKTDMPIAVLVSRSYFPSLINAGIEILSYKNSVFHAKYAVIDEDWATLGSTNIDYLSLLRNREANVLIRDEATIAELKGNFIADIPNCEILTTGVWKSTPFISKIYGYMGRSIRRLI